MYIYYHSSHTLPKWCSKFSNPGFNSTWTVNFQMFKLDLEKAEEPEIKLPTSAGTSKNQENTRKTSISAVQIMPKLLIVLITTNWKILRDGNTRPSYLPPEKSVCRSRTIVRTGQGATDWFKFGKWVHQGCILSPRLFNLYAEYIMVNAGLDEAQAGIKFISVQFSCSVISDSLTPHGLQHTRPPFHHQLPEFTQIHVHWVCNAIQPSHPLPSPSAPAFNLSQHQGLFKWDSSLHQVAKILVFQLQHQSFQWIFRTDFL